MQNSQDCCGPLVFRTLEERYVNNNNNTHIIGRGDLVKSCLPNTYKKCVAVVILGKNC